MRNADTGSLLSSLYLADGPAGRAQDILMLAARLLIGWIFIMSGWGKLMDIPKFATTMARRGLPDFLGYVAPPVEFFGGLFMVLGFATRYTALVMILFMIIATFSSHRYWTFSDPALYAAQSSNFWKNVSMTGGIVLLFVSGAGRYAVDRLLRKS